MNNIFNLSRFWKLFRKHTIENYKGYLMSLLVVFAMLASFYIFLKLNDAKPLIHEVRVVIFLFSFLAAGSAFTSTVFINLSGTNKARAINSLILPASHFEKFLIGWLYSFPIFTLLYLSSFYLFDHLMMTALFAKDEDFPALDIFYDRHHYYIVFYIYTLMNAFALFGALMFKNHHFIKIALLFFGVLVLISLIHAQIVTMIFSKEVSFSPPLVSSLYIKGVGFVTFKKEEMEFNLKFLFYTLTGIMWIAAFLKLKEKEV